ncbi:MULTISPECIES: acyl-CoA dehydrogenase family protein [Pseudomonas]|uniref:Putative acyl-CoA dehydrogenase n=1 Tax=Pseudomonas fluorescens (strain Pf0-1) TaxID=205922 RepID=Q3KFA4_PSEPF|nr:MULTISPECIES: acyl-CoA dehydrogenase family protein [Pseudomonas]ABA73552.1 putative acyl-CoA dehydrogenase [Pseudomonas fluorescens Pf0-1]MBL0795543.1 acyl-CoA dehydrogenase family protein [Pseudomonas sp. B7]MBY9025003.1 acyl-CoA dehydrogenase family protein [Pseudomonas fluorescens]MBY9032083.1 acyl-CoA dehydrogenase family protein [Pseudomonas fluorescens]MBY9036228.1 acyl-CoA dehydrogenase family protein [Pseudomonas fluorescens]
MPAFQEYFDPSHQMVRDSVSRFVEREILPDIDAWEEAENFPRELYLKAGAAGILGIGYPEALGGSHEGDLFAKIAASEELMRCGSGGLVAGLGSLDIGLPPIVKWARPEVRDCVVPQVLRGEKISALAVTEPGGGSDVANLQTRAVRDGDYYRVSGSKTFITSGVRADYYTVAVRTGAPGFGGISLLLIEKSTPGFTVGRQLKKMGWWASDTAELFFDDCRVPVGNLIGAENMGFACIMGNFQSERLALALMANMTAQLALEESVKWAKEREAFGKPIGKFQVIKHRLAEMATTLEVSREFTYRQAAKMAAGQSVIKEISMAKNFATDTSDRITNEAVQILGGLGYVRESLVERLYRDNRILSIGGGTREVMNEIISKQMGL